MDMSLSVHIFFYKKLSSEMSTQFLSVSRDSYKNNPDNCVHRQTKDHFLTSLCDV